MFVGVVDVSGCPSGIYNSNAIKSMPARVRSNQPYGRHSLPFTRPSPGTGY